MTLLQSPININVLWGIPIEDFDIQEFIAMNLEDNELMILSPEQGLGRRVLIGMFDKGHKKLIQVYSQTTVPDIPSDPLGYQEDDLMVFDGVVVGDVTLDEHDDITYWGATTYSHEDFEKRFVTDKGFSIVLRNKLDFLRTHSYKVDTIIEQADQLWSSRELGQTTVMMENPTIC